MGAYHNIKITKQLGARLAKLREERKLEAEDVAEMTGFTANTIRKIEDGRECSISYFIEIAFAIGVHPKDVLDIDLDIKPRYALSARRKEKSRLTQRISELIETDFFETPRFVGDIVKYLDKKYKIETHSPSVSVTIARLQLVRRAPGKPKLMYRTVGRRRQYYFK